VDQDFEEFSVLQSFMRLGSVDSSERTEKVLLQAEFLGMDRLLAAVKCVAYCNVNSSFTGSCEKAVAAFDFEHQGVAAAVPARVLPTYLTKQKGEKKEYAKIKVWKPENVTVLARTDLYVSVRVGSNTIDSSVQGRNPGSGLSSFSRCS
jgi:hypothetical protein